MKKQILFLVSISSLIFNYGFAGSTYLFEDQDEKPTWFDDKKSTDENQRKENWHQINDQFNRVDDANRFTEIASFFDCGDNYRAVISLPDYTKKIVAISEKRQKLYEQIAANYPDYKEAICNKMKREEGLIDQALVLVSKRYAEELEHSQRLKMFNQLFEG